MATNSELIRVVDVVKEYNKGEVKALNGCSLTVNRGEVVAIVGSSGSGKSTMLRCLNMLEVPTSGHIYFDGVDLADKNVDINLHRRKMGMVFQHFNLFPHKTVMQIWKRPMNIPTCSPAGRSSVSPLCGPLPWSLR